MSVKIVTDSAADLTVEQAEALGVQIVPLSIRFGDEEFVDVIELTPAEFYKKMASSPHFPETAAPSIGAFENAIREAGSDGSQVVVITISGDLSGTMTSALNAAREIGDDIDVRVVDSKGITATLGQKVIAAAKAASEGQDADQIVEMVERMREHTHVFGALNTLDNLKKGGRIGGATAMLGSIMSIKPIVDISSGKVEEATKVRTRKKALLWLRDHLYAQPQIEDLAVCSGAASDTEEFLDLIADRYPRDSVTVWTIGPVIGTHGGAGVLGIAWHDKD